MNRLAFVLTLAFVLALAGMAMASEDYDPAGAPLPEGAKEEPVFVLSGDSFIEQTTTEARAWNSLGFTGHCNQECASSELVTHVSVAQWLNFTVSGTRKDWRVLKPGTYASNSVTANITSNNDVRVRFYLDDPTYLGDAESPAIEATYGYSDDSGTDPGLVTQWQRANGEENAVEFTIPYEDIKNGSEYHIWQQITVTEDHRSSDYEGTGLLQISVTNLKHWVDPESGGFLDGANGTE